MENRQVADDPFLVLGVPPDAGDQAIRQRYLELVKRHPPERDPEGFRRIQRAYQLASDPLAIADRLVEPPSDEPVAWRDALVGQENRPPQMTTEFLLSLGNRPPSDGPHGIPAPDAAVPESD